MIEVTLGAALAATRILPVVVLSDAAEGAPLTAALAAGGLPVVEITLERIAILDRTQGGSVRARVGSGGSGR